MKMTNKQQIAAIFAKINRHEKLTRDEQRALNIELSRREDAIIASMKN